MGDGTSNYGKVAKLRFIVRCSSLPELPSEKKKEALLYICLIVFFILVFFLVMWMSLFCVVMLEKQLLER